MVLHLLNTANNDQAVNAVTKTEDRLIFLSVQQILQEQVVVGKLIVQKAHKILYVYICQAMSVHRLLLALYGQTEK